MGALEILNCGEGDIKIQYNTSDAAEAIRARRIITDMLRRGYALLIEVERDGQTAYERVQQFDEKAGCYIIADFDSTQAREADMEEAADDLRKQQAEESDNQLAAEGLAYRLAGQSAEQPPESLCKCGRPLHHRGACRGPRRRSVPMETATVTAVGRPRGG